MLTAVRRIIGDFAGGLATFLWPSRCRSCLADLGGGGPRLLCPACRLALSAPLPADWRGRCLAHAPGQAPEFGRFPYVGPAGVAVRLLKFDGHREMAGVLAAGTAPLARAAAGVFKLDTVVPVPLHGRRRRERRFNQSELIGERLARETGLGYAPQALARVRYTTPQVKLGAAERHANVRGAFAPGRDGAAGRRVMLVDDVITTGATVRECARVLFEAGARAVTCVAAARAGAGEDA